MIKLPLTFLLGLSLLSVLFGFLVGVSSSPVLGVFITGVFGLLVAVIGIKSNKQETISIDLNKQISTVQNNFRIAGMMILVFVPLFLISVGIGSALRNSSWPFKVNEKQFIWDESNKPNSAYEAIDWIIVQNKLVSMGYSEEQVKYLYRLQKNKNAKSVSEALSTRWNPLERYEPISSLFAVSGISSKDRSVFVADNEPHKHNPLDDLF